MQITVQKSETVERAVIKRAQVTQSGELGLSLLLSLEGGATVLATFTNYADMLMVMHDLNVEHPGLLVGLEVTAHFSGNKLVKISSH